MLKLKCPATSLIEGALPKSDINPEIWPRTFFCFSVIFSIITSCVMYYSIHMYTCQDIIITVPGTPDRRPQNGLSTISILEAL